MLNLLFVTYQDFTSNSAIQIHNFANSLVKLGNECCVAVPSNKNSVFDHINGEILYTPLEFSETLNSDNIFSNGEAPYIIHAWTPREILRKHCCLLKERFPSSKLIIHLEDNEEYILEKNLSISMNTLNMYSNEKLQKIVPDSLSHPKYYKDFLNQADGVTVIMDKLLEFVPRNKPQMILWPGLDINRFFPREKNIKLKKELGIKNADIVITYTGNVHAANAIEVRSLYLAVALLNREGISVKLIRAGKDFCDFLGKQSEWAHENSIELGIIPNEKIPSILALADILVQPGRSDKFNDYRLPSKIPEFLGMGIPTIIPRTNIGRFMMAGKDVLILKKGDALEILAAINEIINDKNLSNKLSQGGFSFAMKNFNIKTITKNLELFYKNLLYNNTIGHLEGNLNDERKSIIINRYNSYKIPELSYAVVKDFCDSTDNLNELCSLNGDLKNVQRPWTFKAIISKIKPGSKLIEIGAGEPVVASFLAEFGYDVIVVDPYDGSGNGPTDYQIYKKRYPKVKIIKNYFEYMLNEIDAHSIDCIYSISVLEHISDNKIYDVYNSMKKFLAPNGFSIHSIDHVIAGKNNKEHDAKIRIILENQGLLSSYDALIENLIDDVETFYLSAEGHNLWRGSKKYEIFPFRKVVSIQLCSPINLRNKRT